MSSLDSVKFPPISNAFPISKLIHMAWLIHPFTRTIPSLSIPHHMFSLDIFFNLPILIGSKKERISQVAREGAAGNDGVGEGRASNPFVNSEGYQDRIMSGFCLLAVTLYLELLGRSWDYSKQPFLKLKQWLVGSTNKSLLEIPMSNKGLIILIKNMSSVADGLAESKMTNIQHLRQGEQAQDHASPSHPQQPSQSPQSSVPTTEQQFQRSLLQLEHHIRDIGDQLRDHHLQGLKLDSNLEQRRLHQDKRTQLRKQLIQASQDHKDLLARKEKATRDRLEREQKERVERERREVEELEEKVKEAREGAETKAKGKAEEVEITEEAQEGEATEEKQEKPAEEKKVEQAKGLSRIAQIQAELAESRLRESRRRLLDAELATLRVRLSLSPLYSYPLYPLSPYYYPRSYLYPYSSLYRYWY